MASTQELEKKYASQLSQLKAIFPSWDQADLAFTLQDARGNVDEAAMMITEGRAAQFTSATKKKPVKAESKSTFTKGHSNRNADSAGWEQVNGAEGGAASDSRAGRGGRGGARGGAARGGRGGRGGEPFRGGRGGRGGIRGGRGGFAGAVAGGSSSASAGAKTAGDFPTSTDTSTEGWASQVQQATSAAAEGGDDGGWGESAAPAEAPVETATIADTSKREDFSAAGGWGDAPSAKEIEKAAKTGGTGWQEDIKKPVQVAAPSAAPALAAAKPKLTWAQIAKPQEKPKPAPPPPAPVAPPAAPEPEVTSDEPVAQEEEVGTAEDAEAETSPEQVTTEEPIDALGDAPAEAEIEAEAEKALSSEAQAEPARTEEPWTVDPAIAAVGGQGAQPSWDKSAGESEASAPVAAPEPVTTYTGPPGFNTVASKAQVAAQPQAIRTNSRAALRHQKADESGVVLPPTLSSGLSSMEVQFGSLSFGSANPDGIDTPVPERAATPPAPAAAAAAAVSPPVRTQQAAQAAPSQQTAPFYGQQQQHQTPIAAPATSVQPQATQQPTFSPHETLVQQRAAYQAQQQHWQSQQQQPVAQQHQQHQHQHQQQHDSLHHPSHQQQHQPHQPPQAQQQQQQGFYRGGQDYYGAQTAESHQQAQTQPQQQQQQQPSHLPPSSSYDAGFGTFGGSHLFGGQSQQHQTTDYGHRSYDSYAASGYPRPPVEETKQVPAQSLASQPGQPQVPSQPYFNQMNYYQAAPYNPYYQYGQGHNPGFQPYYPLAGRGGYGQAPQAPSAPVQQQNTKPVTQSPYGQPASYQTNSYDDTFGNFGRFGGASGAATGAADNKMPASSGLSAQQSTTGLGSSYGAQGQQQGLHGYLGGMNASASSRPEDNYGSKAGGAGAAGQVSVAQGRPQQGGAQQGQQGGPQQHQQQQQGSSQLGSSVAGGIGAGSNNNNNNNNAAGAYGGYGGYGNQEWSQYGYGNGRNNGYSQWQ